MKEPIEVTLPLTEEQRGPLRAGDRVVLSGQVYGARDAVHKRFIELLDEGLPLPVSLCDEVIFYLGPTPAPPGRHVGAVGPTTSSRMDPYTERLFEQGLKGTIGKGPRSPSLRAVYSRFGAVHFAATGGAAAVLSQSVARCEVVAYPELGPEALRRLDLDRMPVVVAVDSAGQDIYVTGRQMYACS